MHLFCHDNPETLNVQTDVADARPGKVVTRDRLHEELWEDEDISSNSLEVHVSRVRRMLRDSATLSVVALRGVGYRLDVVA